MTADLKRNKIIKAIQACRRKVEGLGDDEPWRDFLERASGGRSLRDMTGPQLGKVLDALHRAGAPKTSPRGGRPRYVDSKQLDMIRGLWIELADAGVVRSRSEDALSAFIRRQTRQDMGALYPRQATAVIEALKAMRGRTEAA